MGLVQIIFNSICAFSDAATTITLDDRDDRSSVFGFSFCWKEHFAFRSKCARLVSYFSGFFYKASNTKYDLMLAFLRNAVLFKRGRIWKCLKDCWCLDSFHFSFFQREAGTHDTHNRTLTVIALAYYCSLLILIASIVLICESLWIKVSAKWLNVNN